MNSAAQVFDTRKANIRNQSYQNCLNKRQDAFYTAIYKSGQVCTMLNGVFDLGLGKKYYLPKELNKNQKNFRL